MGGSTVYVTKYSTSTIVKEVPTTVPVYVTSITTVYKTSEVYTTTTNPVKVYVSLRSRPCRGLALLTLSR